MKAVNAGQMKHIDVAAVEKYGIPASFLMGCAGRAVSGYIIKNFSARNIAIFCGTGNNGGDGFAAAYFLNNEKISVDIYLAGDITRISENSGIFFNLCKNCGIRIFAASEHDISSIDTDKYDIIIDALAGTGFSGIPKGVTAALINVINSSSKQVVSVDIPSGLSPDGTPASSLIVKADHTVSMGLPKISMCTYPGMSYCGKVYVADIGFPAELTEHDDIKIEIADRLYVKKRSAIFTRDTDSHKGANGNLLIVGGFAGMEGAAMLAADAAINSGAGTVTLLTLPSSRKIIAGKIAELITADLPDYFSSLSDLIASFPDRRFDSAIIGPGMGRSEYASALFSLFMNNLSEFNLNKILIDGDGLYHLSDFLRAGKNLSGFDAVITPHLIEASRLSCTGLDVIKNDRFNEAVNLALKTGAAVVLKGPGTIITNGINSVINTTGNPGMASAGSGDVLSGVIGAFMMKDLPLLDAAALGVYIHGMAADIFCNETGVPYVRSSEISGYIRKAISLV